VQAAALLCKLHLNVDSTAWRVRLHLSFAEQ